MSEQGGLSNTLIQTRRLYNINKVWKTWLGHCILLIRLAEVPLINGAGVTGAKQTNGLPLRHLPQALA